MRLSDCNCPICLNILIEPVTLPCKHELCMPCFKQHVAETSLFCPLCRTRLSVWARRAARQNKLVNQERWKQIKDDFPEQVQNRIDGKEEDLDNYDEEVFFPSLAEPGELRKEYEEERNKVQEERQESHRAEEEASLRLIAEIEAQERERREQERRDLEMAAAISKELNGVTPQINLDSSIQRPTPDIQMISTPRAPPPPPPSRPSTSKCTTPSLPRKPAAPSRQHTSPRAGNSSKSATVTSQNRQSPQSQGHLKMWFRPKPKEATATSVHRHHSDPVVRTTQLTPGDIKYRMEALKNGVEPTSISRDKRKLEDEEVLPGPSRQSPRRAKSFSVFSSSSGGKSSGDFSRKRLCLKDVGNKS